MLNPLPPELWEHEIVYHVARGAIAVAGRPARPVTHWFRAMLRERAGWAAVWEPLAARAQALTFANAVNRNRLGTRCSPLDSVHVHLFCLINMSEMTRAGVRAFVPFDEVAAACQHAPAWPPPTPPASLAALWPAEHTPRWTDWGVVAGPELLSDSESDEVWTTQLDRVMSTLLARRLALLTDMARVIVHDLRQLAAASATLHAAVARVWPAAWTHLGRLALAADNQFAMARSPPVDAAYRRLAAACDTRLARYAELALLRVLWPDRLVVDWVLKARAIPTLDRTNLATSLARMLAPHHPGGGEPTFFLGHRISRLQMNRDWFAVTTTAQEHASPPPPHTAHADAPLGTRWVEYTPSAPHPFERAGTRAGDPGTHPSDQATIAELFAHSPAGIARRPWELMLMMLKDKGFSKSFLHAPLGTHVLRLQRLHGAAADEAVARATLADVENAWRTRTRLILHARAWMRELRCQLDPAYRDATLHGFLTDRGTAEGRTAHERVWEQLCTQVTQVARLPRVPSAYNHWPTSELRKLLADLRGAFLAADDDET